MNIINDNYSALFLACKTGNIDVVEQIINTSVININICDCDGDTALIFAVRNGHLSVVKRLLQHPDVDVNQSDSTGWTPLMWAIFCMEPNFGQFLDIFKTLLQVPSLQLGRMDEDGQTVLHYVCEENLVSVLKLLCEDSRCNPALVNKKDSYGYTALMKAVCWGHLDNVKELDMEGTDFHTTTLEGTTLIQRAMIENKRELTEYLMKRPNVDTLMVICAHIISRYVKTVYDVESLNLPVTVKQFLARFVN